MAKRGLQAPHRPAPAPVPAPAPMPAAIPRPYDASARPVY